MGHFTDTRRSVITSIAYYYQYALGCSPRSEWLGRNGTVKHICEVFKSKAGKRRSIRRILSQYDECRRNNKLYGGFDHRRTNKDRPQLVEEGSRDKAWVADWFEDNLGFRRTTEFPNQHRTEEGRLLVER